MAGNLKRATAIRKREYIKCFASSTETPADEADDDIQDIQEQQKKMKTRVWVDEETNTSATIHYYRFVPSQFRTLQNMNIQRALLNTFRKYVEIMFNEVKKALV